MEYPIGMGGLDLDDGHLRRYLGRRLVILLGDADSDPSAPDLPRWTTLWLKGLIGLSVVYGTSSTAPKFADSLGVHLGWKLEIARGTGHVGQLIYDRGADVLKGTDCVARSAPF